MASFKDAVEIVLKNEGGFVNNPLDKGGATNWGITQKVYEAWKGRPVTVTEMKNMPRSDAIAIYKKNYWDKVGGDAIKFYSVALTIFDQAVNRGISAAVKQAQRVAGVNQDGAIGAQTIAAINKTPESEFLNLFLKESEAAYKTIVSRNPSQEVFLKGWLKRVDHLRADAMKWLGTLNKPALGIGLFAVTGLGIFLYFKFRKKKS